MKTFLDDWIVGETDFQRERKRLRAKMEEEAQASERAFKRMREARGPVIVVREKPVNVKSTNWLKEMEWKG